jgi:hypothetical protein
MSMFDGIASAVGSAGLDALGAHYNSSLALHRQHDAQDFDREMFGSRYQMQTEDMKKAGLNPMLSYMSGAPGSPTSSAASASGTDLSGAFNTGRTVTAQTALLDEQKKNVATDTLVKAATAQQVAVSTEKLSKEVDIKTPKATIYRALENILQSFVGTTAIDKKGKRIDFGPDPKLRYNPKGGWDKFKGGLKYLFGGSK